MQNWGAFSEVLFRPLTLESLETAPPTPVGVLHVFSGPRATRTLRYVLVFRHGIRVALPRAIRHPQVVQAQCSEWVAVSTTSPERRAQVFLETVPGVVVEFDG